MNIEFLLLAIALIYVIHFAIFDWNFSTENQFALSIEENLEQKIKEAKKLIIEKKKDRFKLIAYRENKDGGI